MAWTAAKDVKDSWIGEGVPTLSVGRCKIETPKTPAIASTIRGRGRVVRSNPT